MNNLIQLLKERQNDVIAETMEAIKRAHLKHYEAEGLEMTQQRLKKLYDLTLQSVAEKNVAPMVEYVENIARERFSRGYDLYEVQTAFNVLEEAIWNRILRELQPMTFAEALGLISTVLGIGKDTLARTYVSLASKEKNALHRLQGAF
jgi:hypothetical protein